MPQAALYDALLGAASQLSFIQSAQYSPNNALTPIRISGALDPSDHTVTQSDPRSQLTTSDIHNFIGYLAAGTGLYLASDTIIVPRNIRASGGTFAAGANHEKLAGTKALIVPMSVSANQGDPRATAQLDIHWLSSDGLTAPVTNDQSYTLFAAAASVEHLLGAFYLDGSPVTGVVGVTVNYGIEVMPIRTDGAIYAHDAHIKQRDPSFEVRFVNAAVMESVGPLFANATSASVFLREKATGSTVVADATLTHCEFAFGNGIADISGFGGSGNESQEATVRVMGRSLTIANNVAIA